LDDGNAINDMKLETIGSNKQLFVSTNSKIYRLPLERCSRHLTCRCASLAYCRGRFWFQISMSQKVVAFSI